MFINPLTDFGFKYIFGNAADKEFMLSFLNSLFPQEGGIIDVEYIDKEHVGVSKTSRALIYDLHCLTSSGKKFILEMQNRYQTHFKDRALFYVSEDFVSQGKKGDDWDYSLMPVYGVFLMNFDWRNEDDGRIKNHFSIREDETGELFTDKFKLVFIKIPLLEKGEEDCRETFERWIYLLKNMEMLERIPQSFMSEPVFKRLGKVARVAALSEPERRAYDRSLKAYRDNYAIALTERAEGHAEGHAEGLAEGRAEGRAEGALLIAGKMLRDGMPPEKIAEYTGLSIDEINLL